MPVLETPRLLLRPLVEEDLDAFAAMMADPEVVAFLGSGPLDRADAWRAMATLLGHEVLRGWSNNAVVERVSGRTVGRCGLWRPEGWPGLEVGWVLAREAWGRGYATEAAAAWRDWVFADPSRAGNPTELVSVVHRDNARARVAERIGHRPLRALTVRGFPCVLWGQPVPRR